MAIADLREDLAATLTAAGLKTYAYEPTVFNPPAALVYPGAAPFIEQDTFGEYTVRFFLYVIVKDGKDRQLDELVSLAINTLFRAYAIEYVEVQPELDNGTLQGARFTLAVNAGKDEI